MADVIFKLTDATGSVVKNGLMPLEPSRNSKKASRGQAGAGFDYGFIPLYNKAGEPDGVVEIAARDGDVVRWAREDARLNLEPGTPFEIRRGPPTNYGQTKHIGWVSQPGMSVEPFRSTDFGGEWNVVGGYFLIERDVV